MTSPPRPIDSTGRAAEALRRAMDPNASYVDHSPVGPLKLMSENIPDPRTQFPDKSKQPIDKICPEPEPTMARKRSNPFVEDSMNKRVAAEDTRGTPETKIRSDIRKPHERSPLAPLQDTSNRLPQKEAVASPKVPDYQNLRAVQQPKESQNEKTVSLLLTMANTIDKALKNKTKASQTLMRTENPWCSENVFVDKWIDFTGKYGLGYELSDGTRGVLFNDRTTMTTNDNV
ncbi:Serine/threonine-protein kinase plk1 [Apophysomyces sp. BC1034]|nr:Serine/threonine-protein kinase plk1 [Apophysomyces sp. BC1021]KAG0191065.1 Serine/threonine-protein kinase plk1 [Apophysomyces sp. BC1034]